MNATEAVSIDASTHGRFNEYEEAVEDAGTAGYDVSLAQSKNHTHHVNSHSDPDQPPRYTTFSTGKAAMRAPRRLAAGFTLLEVLVAMSIFFMVSGILASAMIQAFRLSESAATETSRSRDDALRLAWVRETIGLSVANGDMKDKTFIGEPRRVSGFSLAQLDASGPPTGVYEWTLNFDAETGRTNLFYRVMRPTRLAGPVGLGGFDSQSQQVQAFPVASWEGSEGRFRYLDENAQWQDQWPPKSIATLNLATNQNAGRSLTNPLLPVAVELVYGGASTAANGAAADSLIMAIQDRSRPVSSLRELLQ
jgi:prepilin-type N-terminal cleavage/methylation domain-containing protein